MKKILIVEDNSDYREIMSLSITKMGYRVIPAKDSCEAIAFAEAEGPDLIFMDMQLPDVDGVNTTAMLKQNPKTSRIPVVALTAWMSALWEERASKVGIATYLIKPVSLQMLKRPSRNILTGHLPEARCDFEPWILVRPFCWSSCGYTWPGRGILHLQRSGWKARYFE